MRPLVSAIIPTYNRADLLERALRSVGEQAYRPIEAVVVDDGSTDHTEAVIERMREELGRRRVRMIVHRQKNGRAPLARNVGMKKSYGELLAFLDSDDLWRAEFVSRLVGLMERWPSAGLAFSGVLVIDDDDRVWSMRRPGLPAEVGEGLMRRPFEAIVRHMPMQTSGVMVRREVIERVGDFDLELPVVEDWDLWYRIAKEYDFAYTLEGLACNRCHPMNLPKFDRVALESSVKMNLKHLADVKDEGTRAMLLERVRRQMTLLQEELLRNGGEINGCGELLGHPLAPQTARYALGTMLVEAPGWVGRSYGRMIRMLGEAKRGWV